MFSESETNRWKNKSWESWPEQAVHNHGHHLQDLEGQRARLSEETETGLGPRDVSLKRSGNYEVGPAAQSS